MCFFNKINDFKCLKKERREIVINILILTMHIDPSINNRKWLERMDFPSDHILNFNVQILRVSGLNHH